MLDISPQRTDNGPLPRYTRGMRDRRRLPQPRILAAGCCLVLSGLLSASAEPLRVTAAVSAREVFVGESFQFQIQVSGSEKPDKPDLSVIRDFSVEDRGGQQNSSRSVTIINGRVNHVVRRGYVFSYRLTPVRPGTLAIPAITVAAKGRMAKTEPVTILVRKPMEIDNFKLRLQLSKKQCYVGEPVTLTVTWYLGQDVRAFQFNLPILENESLYFADPHIDTNGGGKYYRIPIGDGEVVGEKGRGRLEGKDYATIRFRKVLIPKEAGTIAIGPATVACDALAGYKKSRSRFDSFLGNDFFSDFFSDGFLGRRRGVYRKVVVPSNRLMLQVSALPPDGRPPDFAGHVGEYFIDASATPTKINVGDPITLKIALSGPEYLDHVGLPLLSEQPALARDFKIPEERADGKSEGKVRVFTQTIRALRSDVTEIPQIELPYFDTANGTYQVARTDPIPLTVKATKVLTADDAEGRELPSPSSQALVAWTRGIAHNYEDTGVIRDQTSGPKTWLTSPGWLSVLGIPPLTYFLLLTVTTIVRRRNADPLAIQARKAYAELVRALKEARRSGSDESFGIVLDAMRRYLGGKLRIPAGALTFREVEKPLTARGVDESTLNAVRDLFEKCEAGRYAGHSATGPADVVEPASELANRLEQRLR